MKKAVLIITMALAAILTYAQSAGKQSVFNVAKPNKVIAVAPTKMAVLYIGVDNPVEMAISDMPVKYITATVDSGEIDNKGDGQFIVRINKPVRATKINVFENYNGTSTKIGEKIFRVKKVPDPVATIANVTSGIVTKSTLSASGGIIPVMKDFDFELFFTITSFTMTMKVGVDLVECNSTGNKLTAEMVTLIQRAPKGTKVWFENIKATGPDGISRSLSAIPLKLI